MSVLRFTPSRMQSAMWMDRECTPAGVSLQPSSGVQRTPSLPVVNGNVAGLKTSSWQVSGHTFHCPSRRIIATRTNAAMVRPYRFRFLATRWHRLSQAKVRLTIQHLGRISKRARGRLDVSFCAGFRTPECRDHPRARAAGVRKAPRHEIAGCGAPTVQRTLWGFGRGVSVGEVEARPPIRSLYFEAWAWVPG